MYRTSLVICSGMSFTCISLASNPRFKHGAVFATLEDAEADAAVTGYPIWRSI